MTTLSEGERSPPHRYALLDGLRGVAALIVVFYHIGQWMNAPWLFSHGFLAVDLFFCLSGFVLASAYQERLVAGMTFRSFALRRLVRLWPLIVLGTILGAIYHYQRALGGVTGHDFPTAVTAAPLSLTAISVLLGIGALFIPNLRSDDFYPLNPPTWSLLFEVGINLVWAVVARWLGTAVLVVIATVAAVALVLLSKLLGTINGGFHPETVWLGLARVTFSFTAGLLVHRAHLRGWPRVSVAGPVLVVIILAMLGFPMLANGGLTYDLAAILFGVPMIVFFGARSPAKPDGRLVRFSGEISYPLYLLHWPLWLLITGMISLTGVRLRLPLASSLTLLFVGLAWLALKGFDEPVRAALKRWVSR